MWVPSQKGLDAVRLQPQNHTVLVSSDLNTTGVKPVPEWEPSQNGWFWLRPQAHHAYFFPATKSA